MKQDGLARKAKFSEPCSFYEVLGCTRLQYLKACLVIDHRAILIWETATEAYIIAWIALTGMAVLKSLSRGETPK